MVDVVVVLVVCGGGAGRVVVVDGSEIGGTVLVDVVDGRVGGHVVTSLVVVVSGRVLVVLVVVVDGSVVVVLVVLVVVVEGSVVVVGWEGVELVSTTYDVPYHASGFPQQTPVRSRYWPSATSTSSQLSSPK
jgi:hypothetical protein